MEHPRWDAVSGSSSAARDCVMWSPAEAVTGSDRLAGRFGGNQAESRKERNIPVFVADHTVVSAGPGPYQKKTRIRGSFKD